MHRQGFEISATDKMAKLTPGHTGYSMAEAQQNVLCLIQRNKMNPNKEHSKIIYGSMDTFTINCNGTWSVYV